MREYKNDQRQPALQAVNAKTTKRRIVDDVVAAGLICGTVTIPQYDEVEGIIEIHGEKGDRSGSFLFTPDGRYLSNKGLISDPLCWGNRDLFQEAYRIVDRHNPNLARRLAGYRPG